MNPTITLEPSHLDVLVSIAHWLRVIAFAVFGNAVMVGMAAVMIGARLEQRDLLERWKKEKNDGE